MGFKTVIGHWSIVIEEVIGHLWSLVIKSLGHSIVICGSVFVLKDYAGQAFIIEAA